jgi:hypothetical protein
LPKVTQQEVAEKTDLTPKFHALHVHATLLYCDIPCHSSEKHLLVRATRMDKHRDGQKPDEPPLLLRAGWNGAVSDHV